jgi:hypothetical protein
MNHRWTLMNTDKENRKRENQRLSVCIRGLKQTDLREEKALAGFESAGYSGNYIQPVVSTPFAALTT